MPIGCPFLPEPLDLDEFKKLFATKLAKTVRMLSVFGMLSSLVELALCGVLTSKNGVHVGFAGFSTEKKMRRHANSSSDLGKMENGAFARYGMACVSSTRVPSVV
jgi:hypothetical protein